MNFSWRSEFEKRNLASMFADLDSITELKRWALANVPLPPVDLLVEDRLLAELQVLGLERVHIAQVGPHPVWFVRARLGRCQYDFEPVLKAVFTRMLRKIGFIVRMRDMITTVGRGRVQAVFCLDRPV